MLARFISLEEGKKRKKDKNSKKPENKTCRARCSTYASNLVTPTYSSVGRKIGAKFLEQLFFSGRKEHTSRIKKEN